jgi:flagellar basal-body rod modification protein FlgD
VVSSFDIISNTNEVYFKNGQKNLGSSRLDREGFMRLMLAQLQYQDPTEPQDNSAMLEQQLQLEQADQMKSLVDSNRFGQASSTIGMLVFLPDSKWDFDKGVSTTPDYDTTTGGPKMLTGVVESVQFDRNTGKALLKIGNNFYDSDLIKSITVPPPTTDD